MSFNDVRGLSEHLKLLGYGNAFPLQALSSSLGTLASFQLVAEILQWLVALLEPGTVLIGGTETEEDRVQLIRSAVEFFVTKSALKLNPRKLYASSNVTAAELLKITRLLIAPTEFDDIERDEMDNYQSQTQLDIGDKMNELRRARELSSDLTQRGAGLYDLLSKEMINRDTRLAQANRPMELASVERSLKNAIQASQVRLQANRAQLENSTVELGALTSKLQRKKAELERTKQRLEALQKIRPAHMQEFEECEKELEDLFQQYFKRLHVRDSLRAQLDARTKRITPVSSPILQKTTAESSMPFIPEGVIDDDDLDDDETQLGGATYVLDSELLDIRDEDILYRNAKKRRGGSTTSTSHKRPGSATSRMRPTTGRSRRSATQADTQVERGRQSSNRPRSRPRFDDDNSSFGSSDSDLELGGLIGIGKTDDGGTTTADIMGTIASSLGGLDDDEFDLNSMEDISISKITGELPLRPKTASKPEHHSDEDF